MTAKMGRYRYWGDQKPDTSRPLLTLSRPQEAVAASARTVAATTESTTTGTLRIYGPIDSWGGFWGVSSKEVAQALDLLGNAERIIVRVNSPGGESSEGRAIVNLLRAHAAEIVTVVDGAAYSAASYIAACGDDSVMSPGSTMMIHDTSTFLYGNEAAFRKAADTLGILSDSGAELYAEIAGGTVEEWREKQRAETWYSAATAVESGLMKRVALVPDVGVAETAGEDAPDVVDAADVEERARAAYDLSLFDKAPEGLTPQPPSASAAGSISTEGGSDVAFSDEQIMNLRRTLGVAEDADETTIMAALSEALDERAEPTPSAPAVPAGMALVDEGTLTQLRSDAAAGREARNEQQAERRRAAVEAAISDGRIPPSRREHWENQLAADPEAVAVLDSLAPGTIPVSPIGHDGEPETATQDDSWFPGYSTPTIQKG